jgi:hypothetical protein
VVIQPVDGHARDGYTDVDEQVEADLVAAEALWNERAEDAPVASSASITSSVRLALRSRRPAHGRR